MRRWVYTLLIFAALLISITGLSSILIVLAGERETANDTTLLGAGFVCLVLAGTVMARLATPAVLALRVSTDGFAWRTLLGWHVIDWREIDAVLVRQHSQPDSREVFVKAGDARIHFGWSEGDGIDVLGPLDSVQRDQARSLLHTLVRRAGLAHFAAGVWARHSLASPVLSPNESAV